MGKINSLILLVLFIVSTTFIILLTNYAEAEEFGGVEFPDGTISFADVVIRYAPTNYVKPPHNNPTEALGIPNYAGVDGEAYVSLGDEGFLVLQFTDNSLTTSGDDSNDLWIFEIGPALEPTSVAISINGNDWINVGKTSGATSGIDIDAYVGSGVVSGEKYSFVKITDLLPDQGGAGSPYEGADIDAVGVISSDEAVAIIANAGTDQIVYDEITFEGGNSYPSEQIESYHWQIRHREDSDYNFIAEGVNPKVSDLKKGFYDVTLTVADDKGETATDKMFFSATGATVCDVNGDGKTGLEEAIHALQIVTELRY